MQSRELCPEGQTDGTNYASRIRSDSPTGEKKTAQIGKIILKMRQAKKPNDLFALPRDRWCLC